MTAFAMVELEITDADGIAPYRAAVEDTVTAHGGRYRILGGETEVLEGGIGEYPVKVLIEFPTMDAAKRWYQSDAYQAILPHRLNHSRGNFLLVEGLDNG
ncbi:DUF1330 domain-containing protein [Marinobacter sp. R17]|uniref:DUF1330 domain-containing protein n=1 Tax=Marinobacter sp. R17 TaxID=2484250 RepID=UPI000F4CF779|nr:DUF1330 domain-containing protein [Marinobacter sp. R17]ROT99954.1 DUF1330 domain-containing protein [Marinobacter sp. R17]